MQTPASLARARLVVIVTALSLLVACATSTVPEQPTDIAVVQTTPARPTANASPAPATASAPPAVAPTPTPLRPTTPPELTDDIYPPRSHAPLSTAAPPTDEAGPLIEVETGDAPPTRIVIAALGIDLAVMASNPSYPYCNVAQYLTNFVNPGQPGSTYMYGHARTGMLLPLLTQSKINGGAAMIGMRVDLYTADKKLHVYRINIVKRHVTDFTLATELRPGQHRLVIQTSEGPSAAYPKLQVAARPIAVYKSTAAQALPTPRPRICH